MTPSRTLSTSISRALRIGAAAVLLSLGACASLAPPAGTPQQSHVGATRYHDAIDLKGRLSLRYEHNGKEEAMHGNFEWSQASQHIALTLSSPLGQTLATVDIEPGTATLKQANEAPRSAPGPDALIADTLGWPLPVSGLREWLQGFAVDSTGKRIAATPQTIDTITTQDGWRLRYVAWDDASSSAGAASSARPKRIDVERHTAQAGAVSLRIVIDEWQPH